MSRHLKIPWAGSMFLPTKEQNMTSFMLKRKHSWCLLPTGACTCVSLLSPSVWEMEPSRWSYGQESSEASPSEVVSEQLSKTVEFLWLFTAMPTLCKEGPFPQVCGNNGHDVQSQKGECQNPHSGHSVS